MTNEPDPDDADAELYEDFIECLYGLYGPEDSEAESIVEDTLKAVGGDLNKAEEVLAAKFEKYSEEIHAALDQVVPDRVATLLAYDVLCERIRATEGQNSLGSDEAS
jgi:hypothetical protein